MDPADDSRDKTPKENSKINLENYTTSAGGACVYDENYTPRYYDKPIQLSVHIEASILSKLKELKLLDEWTSELVDTIKFIDSSLLKNENGIIKEFTLKAGKKSKAAGIHQYKIEILVSQPKNHSPMLTVLLGFD